MPSISARALATPRPAARPLALENLRTFAAVARTLSFRAAADELHLTQSAISRRVQALEDDLGLALFARDTRKVEPTHAGEALLQAVTPALDRIDRTVARLRADQSRRHVSVSTFGTFATLWLLPRLEDFQRTHPDIDIRIEASDKLAALDDPDLDVALRYAVHAPVPPHAERMFGEVITPVASPMLVSMARAGRAPALATVADLARHAFFDQDEEHPGSRCSTWRYWLRTQGEADIAPRRRVTVNYGHQGIQAAMAGQGLAIGRLGLIHDTLARGELVEVFGPKARAAVPAAYWMVPMLNAVLRPELARFLAWVREQAAATRKAIGEADAPAPAQATRRNNNIRSP
jgi:LysR family transcriptional regulator, glycine cleavage system transcriptional activator